MSEQNVYFKQNVLVEPLFNQWYVWPYLIPPVSAAMYITNWHLKIMESFVEAPEFHVAALTDPSMMGGPFINYPVDRADEIKALLNKTRQEQTLMLELAEAINSLDSMLQVEAKGCSLESLYPKVPECLRGYVELVYDLHNHASPRFVDGLLYKSKYYNPASQSIALSLCESDNRSFVFSTPRLKGNGSVFLDVPFNAEGLDTLFQMKFVPGSYERIKQLLNVAPEDEASFSQFFTNEEPRAPVDYQGSGVRIRYFGHACLLIEAPGVSILTDPVISYKEQSGIDRYLHADLPRQIDYVLITHNHQDHVMFETLLQLRHKVKNLIVPRSSGSDRLDPSLKQILRTTGFDKAYEIDELETIEIPGGRIIGLPFWGEHCDLNVRTKLAYRVELQGNSMLIAADSNNIESRLYRHVHELFGEVDLLFLGMECDGAPMSWNYGALFTSPISRKDDQSRRILSSTYEKAIDIVNILKPKQVYVYAMGQEPWLTFVTTLQYTEQSRPIIESNKLVSECLSRGLVSERLYIKKELFLSPSTKT